VLKHRLIPIRIVGEEAFGVTPPVIKKTPQMTFFANNSKTRLHTENITGSKYVVLDSLRLTKQTACIREILTVRMHMGVFFDPTVRIATIASVLFVTMPNASMTLKPNISAIDLCKTGLVFLHGNF